MRQLGTTCNAHTICQPSRSTRRRACDLLRIGRHWPGAGERGSLKNEIEPHESSNPRHLGRGAAFRLHIFRNAEPAFLPWSKPAALAGCVMPGLGTLGCGGANSKGSCQAHWTGRVAMAVGMAGGRGREGCKSLCTNCRSIGFRSSRSRSAFSTVAVQLGEEPWPCGLVLQGQWLNNRSQPYRPPWPRSQPWSRVTVMSKVTCDVPAGPTYTF